MKIYEEVLRPNGRVHVKFLGVKIYSYKKYKDSNEYYRSLGVKIGKDSKFVGHPNFGSEPFLIEIGDNCLVSFDVVFLTHDASYTACKPFLTTDNISKFGRIKICDETFIGCNTTILPNVTIGKNCIAGAGSVVTKSIPDGEVWAGNPAKFLCKTEDLAKKLYEKSKTPEQIELCEYVKIVRGIK